MSKDGVRYDPYHFVDGTGTYKVRNSIGVSETLDADGNELEIPANVISNGFETYDGLQVAGIETDATFAEIIA
jgi:hypothetical protein